MASTETAARRRLGALAAQLRPAGPPEPEDAAAGVAPLPCAMPLGRPAEIPTSALSFEVRRRGASVRSSDRSGR